MLNPALLWEDPSVYRRKPEKAAAALLAVATTLERHRPLGGEEDEFLRLVAWMRAAPPQVFGSVWYAPAAYRWTRLAYELTGAVLSPAPLPDALIEHCTAIGQTDPASALLVHLAEVKRFALSIALLSERALRFEQPFAIDLPAPLPGTTRHIVGNGTLLVNGIEAGCIYADRVVEMACATVVEHDGYELALHPEAFHLPGLRLGRELISMPADFQVRHAATVRGALAYVRRFAPGAFAQFRHIVSFAAVKPLALSDFSNQTHSELPGTFVLSTCSDPLWLADAMVHELLHNRLFALEELGPFLDPKEGNADPREAGVHYSPWRDDLRPLHGILHGLYVYMGLWRFWAAALNSGELDAMHAGLARDQLVRSALQARIGVAQLERFASLTSLGRELITSLADEVDALSGEVDALGLSAEAPAYTVSNAGAIERQLAEREHRPLSVRAAIQEHAARFDQNSECSGLLDALGEP